MSGREDDATLAAVIDHTRRRERVTRAWLLAPALIIILAISILPLGITILYSFLTPGTYGGVTWKFSTDSYVQFLFQSDIFDGTLAFNSAYVSIFLRSIGLALGATIGALLLG
ncbi:MAG: ABC transporter permease, partial [Hoeflea sp.]|nr:ABC transporter permease [Hoeflea sp.]